MASFLPAWIILPLGAAGLHWDGLSSGPDAEGGEGTWSTAADPANWDTAATAGSDVPWADGSDALFGGTGGVVTVSGTVSATSLAFTSQDYRITGGQVTLTGTPSIDTAGNDVTIQSVLAGSVPISKTGTGTLTLSGINTFTGAFTIAAGTLRAGHAYAVGRTGIIATISAGATLDLNGTSFPLKRFTVSGSGVGNAGAIVNNGAAAAVIDFLTLAGPTTVGGTAPWGLVEGRTLTMAGHTLTKAGANEISLSGGLATPGHFDVREGTLWIMGTANLGGYPTNVITVRTGASLGVEDGTSTRVWTIAFEPGSTWRASKAARWNGPVTLAGATNFEAQEDATMVGNNQISGPGSLIKTGPGSWALYGHHTHTGGTVVNAGRLVLEPWVTTGEGTLRGAVTVNEGGTLVLNKPENLGTAAGMRVSTLKITGGLVDNASTGNNSPVTVNLTGGTLRSNGGAASTTATSAYTLAGDAIIHSLPAAGPAVISGRLHLGTGNTGDTTVFHVADGAPRNDLRIDAAITGASAANGITKRGSGSLDLRGPAIFTGATVVEEGALLLDGDGSLPDSPVTVAPGARFGTTAAGKSVTSLTAAGGSSLLLPALTEGALVVEGALDLDGGMVTICPVIGADAPAGTYDLLIADEITGTGTPVLDMGGAYGPTRATGSLVVTGNKLQLLLTGTGGDLVWSNATATGAADGTWDATLANFSDGAGDDVFRAFDAVTFGDSVAPGSAKQIALGTLLAPARVAVENSNGDYTFGSTGSLTGIGSLVKTGSGRLTFAGPRSYAMAGPITAAGGVLDFSGQTISASSLLLTGGASLANATLATGPMELQSGSSNAVLSGSAPWTKTTAGTVTLTADHRLAGPGTIAAGHLIVGSTSTAGATSPLGTGPVAISSGAALTLYRDTHATTDVSHLFTGSGSLNLAGSNNGTNALSKFTLSQYPGAFTGPVNVSDAQLIVTSATRPGSSPITFTGHAALAVSEATFPNALTFATTGSWGNGSSSGTANLFATNATFTGPITLAGGTTTSVRSPSTGTSRVTLSGSIGETGGPASLVLSATYSDTLYTLSGASTYTGSTLMHAPVHLTGSLGATAVTVGSSLSGSGVIGPGGSLTFASNTLLKPPLSGDAITVDGDVNLGLRTLISVDITPGPVPQGPIPVLRYTGTLTGGAGQLAMDYPGKYRQAVFAFPPGLITLDIGARTLFWKASGSDYWDPETTGKPWATTSGGAPTERFYRGDSVVFDDSGPGGLVSGLYSVRPSAITVNNNTKGYGIASVIEGACTVVKQGSGSLSMSGHNTYTGGTTIHGGKVSITYFSPLGTGPVSIAAAATIEGDGTIIGPLTLAGTLDPGNNFQGWPATLSAGPTVFSGNYLCQLDSTRSDTLAVTGDLDITGSTLTLNRTSPYSSPDTYIIATYTGTLTGSFTTVGGMPVGYVLKYDTLGKRIIVTRMSFADWAASYPGLADTTADGDPDRDGMSNLLEHALGGNPASSDPARLPTFTLSASSLVFRYKRSQASRYSTIQTVQWSPDMVNWTDIDIPLRSLIPVIVTANGDLPDDITVTIPRIPGTMYVRLKVAQP